MKVLHKPVCWRICMRMKWRSKLVTHADSRMTGSFHCFPYWYCYDNWIAFEVADVVLSRGFADKIPFAYDTKIDYRLWQDRWAMSNSRQGSWMERWLWLCTCSTTVICLSAADVEQWNSAISDIFRWLWVIASVRIKEIHVDDDTLKILEQQIPIVRA